MKKYFSLFFLATILFVGCSKDDDGGSEHFDGSINSITDFVGEEILDEMIDLGLGINPGDNPPNIEGKYLMSPSILESSNISYDIPGSTFNDLLMEFSKQKGLNIHYKGEQTKTSSVGKGSFISGDGDLFSVFLNVITVKENQPKEMEQIFIFSGRVAPEGIYDMQVALFMIENNGNSGVIANGEGRIFVDGDGFTERVTGLQRIPNEEKSDFLMAIEQ